MKYFSINHAQIAKQYKKCRLCYVFDSVESSICERGHWAQSKWSEAISLNNRQIASFHFVSFSKTPLSITALNIINIYYSSFVLKQKNQKFKTPFLFLENYPIFLSCAFLFVALGKAPLPASAKTACFATQYKRCQVWLRLCERKRGNLLK